MMHCRFEQRNIPRNTIRTNTNTPFSTLPSTEAIGRKFFVCKHSCLYDMFRSGLLSLWLFHVYPRTVVAQQSKRFPTHLNGLDKYLCAARECEFRRLLRRRRRRCARKRDFFASTQPPFKIILGQHTLRLECVLVSKYLKIVFKYYMHMNRRHDFSGASTSSFFPLIFDVFKEAIFCACNVLDFFETFGKSQIQLIARLYRDNVYAREKVVSGDLPGHNVGNIC